MKANQTFKFSILDSTKWPIKNEQEEVVSLPKQIKDVFEEFTQMYEKSKRNSKSSENENNKNSKQKAIILTWNINYGNCEI